jgi:hypothetical protein
VDWPWRYNPIKQYKALIMEKKSLHQETIRLTIHPNSGIPYKTSDQDKVILTPNPIPYSKWKAFYDDIMLTKSEYAGFQGTHDKELDEPFTMKELQTALDKT